MDPAVIASSPLPTDSIIKIGHHAGDHGYEHEHVLSAKKDGHVNPLLYAIEHSWKAAAWGAAMLVGFFGIYKTSLLIAETAPIALGAAGIAIAGTALTGALWYGAQAFIKAYNVAQDYNQGLVNQLEGTIRTHAQEHHTGQHHGLDRERARTELPKRGVVAGGSIIGAPIAHAADESPIPEGIAPEHGSSSRHVQKILAEGPRSLSPKEYATRIHEERTAAPSHSV